jgi:hypothetical protein
VKPKPVLVLKPNSSSTTEFPKLEQNSNPVTYPLAVSKPPPVLITHDIRKKDNYDSKKATMELAQALALEIDLPDDQLFLDNDYLLELDRINETEYQNIVSLMENERAMQEEYEYFWNGIHEHFYNKYRHNSIEYDKFFKNYQNPDYDPDKFVECAEEYMSSRYRTTSQIYDRYEKFPHLGWDWAVKSKN